MENQRPYRVNEGKREFVAYGGVHYACYAIKTSVVTEKDALADIVAQYAQPALERDDVLFISEKMVACTQGRAIPIQQIVPGVWARLLSRFVTRSPYGIGLSMPETMQCAIDECGLLRILLAAFAGMIGRLFGQKGWFYQVAGPDAASVDGPCPNTLPPYNQYAVLGPRHPNGVARAVSRQVGGNLVLIVDANDLGCNVLGASRKGIDQERYRTLLAQNPLGQSAECTPMGLSLIHISYRS